MSQTDAILRHLKAGRVLTPLDALHRFGTLRLAARCHDLRAAGHDIRCRRFVTPTTHKVVGLYYLAP